jgi:neopullulanase
MPVITPEWVKDAIFYQIFPDRFAQSDHVFKSFNFEPWDSPPTAFGFKGGDLRGVVDKLDYLQDLGITAIYLNPVFAAAANHRYHTYDYFTVDPLLGGNAALRQLIDAAHARHIRIILDGVFNHTGRGFWQFHHVLENRAASPYVDWFHFDLERLSGERNFGAYPDPASEEALQKGLSSVEVIGYQAWWNLPALPKFNTKTPAVREFLWKVATHWIEFGIDGWRLDVPSEIDDDDFWREFRRRVKATNPNAYIVGEIWHEAQRWLQGDQFDAVTNYPLSIACLGFFGGDHLDMNEIRRVGSYRHARPLDAQEFADCIDRILGLYDPAITQAQLNSLNTHDTPRFITSVADDQARFRLALLFLFTFAGAPCIFYGDEIVKKCITLRQAHPALRHGEYVRLYAKDGVYVFARTLATEILVVALNAASSIRSIDVPLGTLGLGDGDLLDVWSGARWNVVGRILRNFMVAARDGVVLTQSGKSNP